MGGNYENMCEHGQSLRKTAHTQATGTIQTGPLFRGLMPGIPFQ